MKGIFHCDYRVTREAAWISLQLSYSSQRGVHEQSELVDQPRHSPAVRRFVGSGRAALAVLVRWGLCSASVEVVSPTGRDGAEHREND